MHHEKPSGTAYLIAGSFAASGRDPILSKLLPRKCAELGSWVIRDTMATGRPLLWALRQRWGRAIARLVERLVLPGIQAHYIVRKRFIEDIVRAALAQGARQVINIGAGFDSLCWRLHADYPGVQFIEVDHPGTQRPKKQVLAAHGELQSNLHLCPADLTVTELAAALRSTGFLAQTTSTVFIVEAVLMYLTEDQAAGVFRAIRSLGLPQVTVVFTFMEPLPDGRVNFPHASPFVNWWLRHRAEPFKWGIRRTDLPDFLERLEFEQVDFADERSLRERYLDAPAFAKVPLAEGELVSVAGAKRN